MSVPPGSCSVLNRSHTRYNFSVVEFENNYLQRRDFKIPILNQTLAILWQYTLNNCFISILHLNGMLILCMNTEMVSNEAVIYVK